MTLSLKGSFKGLGFPLRAPSSLPLRVPLRGNPCRSALFLCRSAKWQCVLDLAGFEGVRVFLALGIQGFRV